MADKYINNLFSDATANVNPNIPITDMVQTITESSLKIKTY